MNVEVKKLSAALAVVIFFCTATVVVLYRDLIRFSEKPANSDSLTAVVVVRPGQAFRAVSNNLHHRGILKHPFKFRVLARLRGYDKRIRAGEYRLSSTMTPLKILEVLSSGKVVLYRVTVPEGLTQRQIAHIVEKAGLVSKAAFSEALADKELLAKLKIEADSFEGYLFPETYFFPKGVSAQKIISTMVNRFRSQFKPEWRKQAETLGWSVHDVVTVASIIEKETGDPSERAVISSVFHNRLRKKMRLESDPTVIYGLKDFDGNITKNDLNRSTPYNTYKIRGLPPGPIANPGAASIESALFPADTDYLFFVSKKDRTHQFSTNVNDHNRAVRKYQLSR
jgi:UPF0755 protein